MMPVPEFVPSAEPPTMRRRIRTDIYDRAVPVSDNLSFAVCKTPVLHLDADAMGNRFQLDVYWVGDSQLREKLFGRTHGT
jgi:hypothetical protein